MAAARYVELNPVRAELTKEAGKYPWSSAAAHISGRDDRLVKVEPLLEIVKDWKLFLLQGIKKSEIEAIRTHERTGRPLGSEVFVNRLEKELERILHRQKPGPKKRGDS